VRPNLTKSLHLDTFAISTSRQNVGKRSFIDSSRVWVLYEAHRGAFWSMIAAEYSHDTNFSGQDLEEAFFTNLCSTSACVTSPPTPAPSPEASPELRNQCFGGPSIVSRGFHAINWSTSVSTHNQSSNTPSSADRCSVSSLLTVEKEVRPSKEASAETTA
jgi:hypothetical protein